MIDFEKEKYAISVSQMRNSDRYTIENFTSGKELMYRAAMGIYNSADWRKKRIAIVCGSGNNGGDGYALAGILADNGEAPVIFRISEKFSEDGSFYYKQAKKKGVKDITFTLKNDLSGFDIVVDCILGTGFRGNPEGIVADAINTINNSGAYVISADINSGLNGDTGEAQLAVKSDLTVSIGYYKKGMFKGKAPENIGELVNVDIGIVLTCE
ncbi:MAG: NAD(P)H-hydrate epimerase [Oscillospiraceae bacterium]|nr:NAD(P)H-hydrate epimerase [Oscillospiraceae bacterium]